MAEPNRPIAGIVLAAGSSVRLGQPKQLIRFQCKSLLRWVLEAALASRLEHTVLVLGHEAAPITEALGDLARHPHLAVLVNNRYQDGQGTSLQAGLRAIQRRFSAVMFLLGDQPLVGTGTINTLLTQFLASDKDICVPVCRGKRANPTIFSRRFYDRIFSISGDTGARALIDNHPEDVLRVPFDDPSRFLDVDDQDDLDRLYRIRGTP